MSERTRIVWLVIVMMGAVTVSTAVAVTVIYKSAFEQARSHLVQNVHDQAHLMEAVARFDREHHAGDATTSEAATLSQIEAAFSHYPSEGQIAEIVVARLSGGQIVYLVTHGRVADRKVDPIPVDSHLAEPMRRALAGQSGSMVGLDYRGVEVLAAYEPVPILNAGVVAKMDLADIRAPCLRGATMVIGLALLLITAGAALFLRLTGPMVRHLTETEQRYQRIFSAAPVPIWEQDFSGVSAALEDLRKSGVEELEPYLAKHPEAVRQLFSEVRINEANAAALRLFGARSAAQFNEWFDSTLLPATMDLSASKLQAIWEGRETLLSRTIDVAALDGRHLTVMLSMVMPAAEHGYRVVPVSALDVTADLNLRRREEQLNLIMSSTGEGIFGMDGAGICTFVNRAALRTLGYREERELLGRDMHALIHHACRSEPSRPAEDCPIYRAHSQDVVVRLEDEMLCRADGSCFPAEYRSYPMLKDGVVVGTVVTFNDITERKEREATLLHARKMEVVGQLTGGVAHDFNNLIAIILANLRHLERRLGDDADAEVAELIDDASSAARDGADLIRRLLAFARRQPLEPQWMDLDAFLDHTHRFLRHVTGEGIELVLHRSGELLPVHVDRQQLENAILNLAINARDAMPDGGTLTIEARHEVVGEGAASRTGLAPGDYVVVSVADTGVGMSPEEVRRAVEPFYSTKALGKGSGLGLSAALGFAQQSGGDLKISSAPGRGTTVTLYLPQATPEQADTHEAGPGPEPTPADTPGEAATILVAEDDPRTRSLAVRTLTGLGYHVLEVDNADTAVRMLEGDARVDLLFTDVFMPGVMDGRELGRWARQQRPGLKVLLTSGFFQPPPREGSTDGDRLPFLQKPYAAVDLAHAVRNLLSVTRPESAP